MPKQVIIFALLAFFGFSCREIGTQQNNLPDIVKPINSPTERVSMENVEITTDFGKQFYETTPYRSEPGMKTAGLPFDQNEIINLDEVLAFSGLSSVPAELLQNGFIIYTGKNLGDNPVEAFEIVESADQPVYVSSGIPLHLMHIFFDNSLKYLEEKFIYADLFEVMEHIYKKNIERGNQTAASYAGVALKLLEPDYELDISVSGMVDQELKLIEEHSGFAQSNIFGYKEDFSQYVPRGHYPASDSLKRYFKAMMWLGRMTFPLHGNQGQQDMYLVSNEEAIYLTATALQIVSDLCSDTAPDGSKYIDKWRKIYTLTAFFAGFSDDMSVPEYAEAFREATDQELTAGEIYTEEFHGKIAQVLKKYSDSKIYSGTGSLVSMPDSSGNFDPEDLDKALTITQGFRLFGQRYTFDSEVLGKMVFPTVGYNRQGNQRFMPSGLDIGAVFGSRKAYEILCIRGDTAFADYDKSLQFMKDKIGSFDQDFWHQTLYNNWLLCARLVLKDKGEGYADFLRTEAWQNHCLSNFLASWSALRHDNILYVKQSYTMEAGCAPNDEPYIPPPPSAGFVEPVPEVYAEILSVLNMLQSALESYGYFDEELSYKFEMANYMMETVKEISEKELSGEAITAEEADFLKSFSSGLGNAISSGGELSEGTQTSLVADVHTDQNSSSVLEVASGNLDLAVVVYARPDGYIEAAMGPVLSYWEFTWPMSDRLTDEKWRNLIRENTIARPEWVYTTD
ncbi:DUF3160 domain-containing protein [candidate division WOR-3 bacterium]|nr:DUF3160 domain-containing protein [candidate division WOR-3 bacterium]